MPTLSAISIARPLYEELSICSFSGHVFGLFNRACNLIDARERVIALTSSSIDNGPFSIVIEQGSKFFNTVEPHQPVFATDRELTIMDWHISFSNADFWEPKIKWPKTPPKIPPAIVTILEPYANWPRPHPDTPVFSRTAQLARQAANELKQALVQNKDIAEAVTKLVGLGGGLTPAGDDYLVGTMAALWLTKQVDIPPKIAEIAACKTTILSVAFLRAAAKGEFIQPWHDLVQALSAEDIIATIEATRRIAQFGASSGLDALAGFATTLSGFLVSSPGCCNYDSF